MRVDLARVGRGTNSTGWAGIQSYSRYSHGLFDTNSSKQQEQEQEQRQPMVKQIRGIVAVVKGWERRQALSVGNQMKLLKSTKFNNKKEVEKRSKE